MVASAVVTIVPSRADRASPAMTPMKANVTWRWLNPPSVEVEPWDVESVFSEVVIVSWEFVV